MCRNCQCQSCFFFNDTATTEIYTLSLHDALPILAAGNAVVFKPSEHTPAVGAWLAAAWRAAVPDAPDRSEEHTSELQSRQYLVCRLLLEKKKKKHTHSIPPFYCIKSTIPFHWQLT